MVKITESAPKHSFLVSKCLKSSHPIRIVYSLGDYFRIKIKRGWFYREIGTMLNGCLDDIALFCKDKDRQVIIDIAKEIESQLNLSVNVYIED